MTQRGKYDDGSCFLCLSRGTVDEPVVESRWKLHRIWLCQHHAGVVQQRVEQRGRSRDQVLNELMDSMIDGLGWFGSAQRQGVPVPAEQAEEIAAAEELVDEDLEDMAYAHRAATLRRCSICAGLEDTFSGGSEYEVDGKTLLMCPRDEQAVLDHVESGMAWAEAVKAAKSELAAKIMPPDLMEELMRKHFEQREHDNDRGGGQ